MCKNKKEKKAGVEGNREEFDTAESREGELREFGGDTGRRPVLKGRLFLFASRTGGKEKQIGNTEGIFKGS